MRVRKDRMLRVVDQVGQSTVRVLGPGLCTSADDLALHSGLGPPLPCQPGPTARMQIKETN